MSDTPLVVQYLYVHDRSEAFFYPSVRSSGSVARVAVRYLECALAQAASLSLQGAECELMLATNVSDRDTLGRAGRRLMARMEELGVEIRLAEYRHRPHHDSGTYMSSRYVLDAVLAAAAGQPAQRRLWLTDLDCIWNDPALVFAAAPAEQEIGCIHIPYPTDWDVVGFGEEGRTPRAIGELASSMGGLSQLPPWVGGELLSGTPGALRTLVAACEELDARLERDGKVLPTEEQLLSLAGALDPDLFRDLSHVARRIQTGTRHEAPSPADPVALGLWHLPSEKGLSLRRAANAVARGHTARLRRDLSDPTRTARHFNVAGTGLGRKLLDDSWIGRQRAYDIARTAFGR
jgi:hypothetical protein